MVKVLNISKVHLLKHKMQKMQKIKKTKKTKMMMIH